MGAGDSIKPVNLSACSLVLRSWPLRFEDESFAPTGYYACKHKKYPYYAYIQSNEVCSYCNWQLHYCKNPSFHNGYSLCYQRMAFAIWNCTVNRVINNIVY